MAAAEGEDPLIPLPLGGSLPGYVFARIFGVPHGNSDEVNHVPNQDLKVERLFAGIRTGAAILTHLGTTAETRKI